MKRLLALLKALTPPPSVSVPLGAMVLTIAALFGAQEWYRTYAELNALELARSAGANDEAYRELVTGQRERLRSGPMPIDRAMEQVSRAGSNRQGIPAIAPQPSTDPAPAAGWMHHPGYEAMPAEPPEEEAPAEEAPVEEPPAEETPAGEPAPGATPTGGAGAAPTGGAPGAGGTPPAAPPAGGTPPPEPPTDEATPAE